MREIGIMERPAKLTAVISAIVAAGFVLVIVVAPVSAATADDGQLAPGVMHAANQAALEQSDGVLEMVWTVEGEAYSVGSAFLINKDTILTAYHNIMPSASELDAHGLTVEDVARVSVYSVTTEYGERVEVDYFHYDEDLDVAVMKLVRSIDNAHVFVLRKAPEVSKGEQVTALGFTMGSVAASDGVVTSVEKLATTCENKDGFSGGPLLDADGYVVGVYLGAQSAPIAEVADGLDEVGYSFTLSPGSLTATKPMHRLYNPNSGEHFYTASSNEKDGLVKAGWKYEGIGWTAPVASNTPVYRLYSGTDHHYTISKKERDGLVKVGWKDEGIGWYSDDAKGVPLYRAFNPNVNPKAKRNNSGSHHYTTSLKERDGLVKIGWEGEDIGWYGVK